MPPLLDLTDFVAALVTSSSPHHVLHAYCIYKVFHHDETCQGSNAQNVSGMAVFIHEQKNTMIVEPAFITT